MHNHMLMCWWYYVSAVLPVHQAVAALKSGNYEEALNDTNKGLSTYSGATSVQLKDIAEKCIDLVYNYKTNNFQAVVNDYESIKGNSNFYLVSSNISDMYYDAKNKPNFIIKDINGNDLSEIKIANKHTQSKGDSSISIIDDSGQANVIQLEVINTGNNPTENLVLDFKLNNMYLFEMNLIILNGNVFIIYVKLVGRKQNIL
jgi:hypothetical protein